MKPLESTIVVYGTTITLLVILKIANILALSWTLVLAPIWIPLVILLVVGLCFIVLKEGKYLVPKMADAINGESALERRANKKAAKKAQQEAYSTSVVANETPLFAKSAEETYDPTLTENTVVLEESELNKK